MSDEIRGSSVLWFRHGLRFHDNPALHAAIQANYNFYPIFIFDGESAGTKVVGPNRMRFLLESLKDLDSQLQIVGQRLFVFKGSPVKIFEWMAKSLNMKTLCFEQDCEPIWAERDNAVKSFCDGAGVKWIEKVSHTLWNPKEVIEANGGVPPLTYQMFLYTVSTIGNPPRPETDVDWSKVKFGKLPEDIPDDILLYPGVPTLEDFNMRAYEGGERMVRWVGGETTAIANLRSRILVEEEAFRCGFYLPNQANPDLVAPPTSQSAALRFGCLSVRRFYWTLHDLFNEIHMGKLPSNQNITGQLIWREYFYTMSVDNAHYGEMARNPICLDIPWMPASNANHSHFLLRWKQGMTGYPFIDAAMRQLLQEGWIHHVARNAVASFLTRGDLWLSWEEGLRHFLEHLLDADWSVCAGNWMWVSSSAFEQLLDCSHCVCPVNYGRRLDPWGVYVKRYVPELSQFPVQFIYEPWKLPLEEQEKYNCVIGRDYPERIVEHKVASQINRKKMEQIRDSLMNGVPHCCPSNTEEVRQFMWLPDNCSDHVCVPT
ncbi:cryptochrome-1 [Nilaparvata lugens]|uniref:cryptochrome-1 n=1 Tax=Nilaparvata lugens TaxID=108931 RepID=UPI00193DB78F|nr:cryptochrome-1 [Nilaparvata lugens]XP_039290666.1 cryptochrome-1 [Nilaparvata lugens]XP_039290667.1 cryptochrome-1 [Nilaparvata lugens]